MSRATKKYEFWKLMHLFKTVWIYVTFRFGKFKECFFFLRFFTLLNKSVNIFEKHWNLWRGREPHCFYNILQIRAVYLVIGWDEWSLQKLLRSIFCTERVAERLSDGPWGNVPGAFLYPPPPTGPSIPHKITQYHKVKTNFPFLSVIKINQKTDVEIKKVLKLYVRDWRQHFKWASNLKGCLCESRF